MQLDTATLLLNHSTKQQIDNSIVTESQKQGGQAFKSLSSKLSTKSPMEVRNEVRECRNEFHRPTWVHIYFFDSHPNVVHYMDGCYMQQPRCVHNVLLNFTSQHCVPHSGRCVQPLQPLCNILVPKTKSGFHNTILSLPRSNFTLPKRFEVYRAPIVKVSSAGYPLML